VNPADLCPACLDVLPADYPYDHVAIDRALRGEIKVYGAERIEAMRVALSRGITASRAAELLACNSTVIRHARERGGRPRKGESHVDHAELRRLYDLGHDDGSIAISLGVNRQTVSKHRAKLGLPPLYRAGGRPANRKKAAA
jgi:hypothetical protein